MNEQRDIDRAAIEKRLPDEFSGAVFRGALLVSGAEDNPIRGNLFAAAMRELLSHILHELAPDDQVLACEWFKSDTEDGRPTRAQRHKYVIQGGLSDEYVGSHLSLNIAELRRSLTSTFETLHKATHVRPGTTVSESKEVETLVASSLSALSDLLGAVEHCRATMIEAVSDDLIDEATNEIFNETIQAIDEIAGHYSIEGVDVHDVRTIRIDSHYVWYRATGSIDAELQWGSGSDFRRGDGVAIDHNFPFTCDIPAPVDAPKELDTSQADLKVEDGGWWDNYYDEEIADAEPAKKDEITDC